MAQFGTPEEKRSRSRHMLRYETMKARLLGQPDPEWPPAEPGDAEYVEPIRSLIGTELESEERDKRHKKSYGNWKSLLRP